MLYLKLALGALVWLQIGYHVFGNGWRIWHYGKRSAWSFLLFPVSTALNELGSPEEAPLADLSTERGYRCALAFIWPLKILWSAVTIPLLMIALGSWKTIKGIIWLGIDGPNALARKISGKRPEKPALPAAPSPLDAYGIEGEREVERDLDLNAKFDALEEEAARAEKNTDG